jgi:hypothetical protein
MTYLLYFTAVCLSAVAAYYSIAGLAAIFAASVIPIVIMGSVLEFAKLVVASWLYRSWKTIPFLFKAYFTVALVILMTLTSMGIFGFLSKAHLDQAVPTGDVVSKVAILDEKIKTEKDNVEAARRQLQQMDAQVDQTLARTADDKGAERSLQIRRGQQKERTALLAEIGQSQTRIGRLNEERAPIASELRKVEAEVGPIKYIAALIYGDTADQNVLEKAVRVVIIMIVLVFDPLAVLLLMAAATPIRKEENGNSETKESSSGEDSSTESARHEEPSKEEDPEETKTNSIRDRFLRRFSRTDGMVERSPEAGEDIRSPSGSEDGSSGTTTSTIDVPEVQEPTWTISEPPESIKIVEYDSAGRRVTPMSEEERLAKTIVQEVEELQSKS